MLNDVLKYHLSFGWSLIPLRPKSKEPLIKWQEFQGRKATEAEVREVAFKMAYNEHRSRYRKHLPGSA